MKIMNSFWFIYPVEILIWISLIFLIPSCDGNQITITNKCLENNIIVTEDREGYVICNGKYVAKINRSNGELKVYEMNSSGFAGELLASEETILDISSSADPSTNFSLNTESATVIIDYSTSFYLKLTVYYRLQLPHDFLRVKKTYEFFQSQNIYSQHAFLVDETQGGLNRQPIIVDRLQIRYALQKPSLKAYATTDDLNAFHPQGTNYDRQSFAADRYQIDFDQNATKMVVVSGKFSNTNHDVIISDSKILLMNSVLTLGPENQNLSPNKVIRDFSYQFYPNFGVRHQLEDRDGNPTPYYTFTDWHKYKNFDERLQLIPILEDGSTISVIRKDFLIRSCVHLQEQMEASAYWLKKRAWSSAGVDYPNGEIFTSYSRSFPQMAYLWGYLSHERRNGGWSYVASDADTLLTTLNRLIRHYETNLGGANFDDNLDSGVSYISYAAQKKHRSGNGPKGVINTHADALHFAWIMAEANYMKSDQDMGNRWNTLVTKYHAGSKALFDGLFPYNKTYWGVMRYGLGKNKREPWYNTIALEGICAGYMQAKEYEVDFIDAVLRSQEYDYIYEIKNNETKRGSRSNAEHDPFVARLCRTFPPALSFIKDSIQMSHAISGAGIEEVLNFGLASQNPSFEEKAMHDPRKYIYESRIDQYIQTNNAFKSDWVPGFWVEMLPKEIPSSDRFSLTVPEASTDNGKYWTACKRGNEVLITSNFDANEASLNVEGPASSYAATIIYIDYEDHSWATSNIYRFRSLSPGRFGSLSLELPDGLKAKGLVVIRIIPR